MMIKSLHIHKFGGIVDKRIDFEDGVNVIYAGNEFGKSTVAEFIRAILYGMGKSPQSIRQNARTRFMPWNEKQMGGEITVVTDNGEYTVIRTFGRRKGEDTVTAISAVTGEACPELCVEAPGEVLLGVGADGFEKSLYIRQLSSKIEAGSDDEILKKLVNIVQSGDEGVSYKRAVQILDAAAKELSGTRPRGKLLLLQDEINDLQAGRSIEQNKEVQKKALTERLAELGAQKARLERFTPDKSEITAKKAEYAAAAQRFAEATKFNEDSLRARDKSIRLWLVQVMLAFALAGGGFFLHPAAAATFGVYGVVAAVFFIRKKRVPAARQDAPPPDAILSEIEALEQRAEQMNKENTNLLVAVAQQIGDVTSQIASIHATPSYEFDDKLKVLMEKHQAYHKTLSDIALAKKCLGEAFSELQGSFGRQLNAHTSRILAEITGGRYTEVLVDNDYNMLVRVAETNALRDAQYLSSGAYDQIYFSLRMGIVNMLLPDCPVILDEAFVQYDDTRLALALGYIKKESNRQYLLLSCHKRESEFFGKMMPV